ncbi:hypothetical protein F2Q70_00002651 [Brassica cretica]|uniref:Uncharacterized protein n=1 Tax=Brassica cretica TaxID=69181 RepID=A0A8S9J0Q4_BRACR|nr:hypothetical protein F2Q70_00002651 [Brassica cretica]
MSTADPPGSDPPPTGEGLSQGEAQGSEQEIRSDQEILVSSQISTKVLENVGEKAIQEISNLEVQNGGSIQSPKDQVGGSKGSWIDAVQGQKILRKYDVENNKEEEIERIEVKEIESGDKGGGVLHVEIQAEDNQASIKETSQDIESEKEKEWLDVSPGKSSRPSSPLKFGQVSILTKSRFEVLSPTEEEQEEEENLEQTEEEHEVVQEEDNLTRKMLPRESKVDREIMALKNKGRGEVYKWDRVLRIVEKGLHKWSSTVLLRYCFQAVAYALWHERNVRRVGEASQPATCLIARLDKLIRNRISSLRRRVGGKYEKMMEAWFNRG